ncbi:sulfatase [Christiangramia crocea]|uniref:Sulfatase n=1 Tax=Christiangramia crocea TaxID=2904124 RepID=A0A9X1V0E4_9FLAO|nr:sulfatase [Gramella crocea]MCG9972538.1 sulfatase [Gramella crocea]
MRSRVTLQIIFNLFILLVGLNAFTQEKPNVVLIVLDDLNDYVGVLGGHPQAKTPNIDKMAKEGVLFTNAHSNAPVCAPSRSSFMSGILPSSSGNYGFENRKKNSILSNSKTISEYAIENGYKAFQTGKIQHHSRAADWTEMGVPKYQGPVAYNGIKPVIHPSVPEAFAAIGLLDGTFASLADIPSVPESRETPGYTGWWNHKKETPFYYNTDQDRDLMTDEKSVRWLKNKLEELEESKTKEPFFIAFGIMNPHTPHVAPQKYFDMYPMESLEIPIIKDNDNEDCSYDEVLSGKGRSHFEALKDSYPQIEDGLKAYLQAYLAEVTFTDDIVGEVLNSIEESKFSENTIIILVSDHGYNMGEKEYLFKNSPWEESTRIPFIIKHPKYKANAGKKVNHPVSLIDLYPTIADLCEMKGSTLKNDKGVEIDGYSLKTFLEDPDNTIWEGPDIALTVIKNNESSDSEDQNYSVRSKNYRYVRYSNGSEEFYDHRNDPYEWDNQIKNPKYKDKIVAHKKALKMQIQRIRLE